MIAIKNTDPKGKNHRPWRGAMEKLLDLVKRQRGQTPKVDKSLMVHKGKRRTKEKAWDPGFEQFQRGLKHRHHCPVPGLWAMRVRDGSTGK